MNYQNKSKEELISELKELRQKYNSLKESYDTDIAKLKETESKLLESEERFKTLSSIASEGLMIHENGVILDANLAFANLIGFCTPDELIGKNGLETIKFTPESKQIVFEHFKSNLNETYDIEIIGSDGTIIPMETRGSDILYHDRNVRLVFMRDITDRKKMENKLKESEVKYRFLLENMNEVVMMVDNDDRVEYVNKKFTEKFGYTPEEIIGKIGYEMLLDPQEKELIIEENRKRIHQISSQYEISFKRKNGQRIHFLVSGAPIFDAGGNTTGSIGTMTDITERRQIEIALKASEERYKKLIEALPDMIMLSDLNSNVIYANEPLHRITGLTIEDYYNPNRAPHIHPDDRKIVTSAIKNLLQSNKNYTDVIENRFIDSRGNLHWFSGRTAKLEINGEIFLQTISRDITEQKLIALELEEYKNNLEKLVKERTEEIETLNEELTTTNEELYQNNEELFSVNDVLANQKKQLEETLETLKLTQTQLIQSEKMASIGILTAGIAHEINNPINFISSGITGLEMVVADILAIIQDYTTYCKEVTNCKIREVLLDHRKKQNLASSIENIHKLLQSIRTGVERTTNIVRSLRTFSRLDNESKSLINIHDLLDSSITILSNQLKDHIIIEKNYNLKELFPCYPGKLSQVFLNLLINAIHSIDNKGTIIITTQKAASNDKIEILFKDTGRGMTQETQKKIFDPFFTTKPVGEGTGMGLSIVHGIIQDHHGQITVISKKGIGTEFRIELPYS